MRVSILTIVVALLTVVNLGHRSTARQAAAPLSATIAIDHPAIGLAPYVWKRSGPGPDATAEAAMPGAYLKTAFKGSRKFGLVIAGMANQGCPAPSMPVIESSIDEGPFTVMPLSRTDDRYILTLAEGLDAGKSHRLEVYFRASDLTQNRWESSKTHLRIAGVALDEGGTLLAIPARRLRAIGFGDSITEGVGVDGLFKSWQSLEVNNARATWFPIVCAALDCEYGQLGTGGQGMSRGINVPSLRETWDRYDPQTSRLTDGRLVPEPDYVFCCHGTNDYDRDIASDYTGWLAAMRKACPRARLFCIVPPLGLHRLEIVSAVEARRRGGDRRVHLIETDRLKAGFRVGQGATQFGFDGVHPSGYGSALLGALIAAEAQKVLSLEK